MGAPPLIPIPHELPALEVYASKGGFGLVTATEGVEETIMQNGRSPVSLQNRGWGHVIWVSRGHAIGASPNFFERMAVCVDTQKDGANPVVRGRNKYKISI